MTIDRRSDAATRRRELLRRTLVAQRLAAAEDAPADLGTDHSGAPPNGSRRPAGPSPLSPGQRRMWSLQQFDPSTTGYNVRIALDLTGPVRLDALVAAIEAVVTRHDILRTTYQVTPQDQVVQVVQAELAPTFDRRDLGDLPVDERSARAGELCAALAAIPFDLAVDSPLRIGLYSTGSEALTLIVVAHHIAWDDGTSAIFFGELAAHYLGNGGSLPQPRQYADLVGATPSAAAVSAAAASADLAAGLDFWREALTALPDPLLVPDLADAAHDEGGTDQSRALRPGLGGRIREVARAHGASTFIVLLAAVTDLLYRHTGTRELLIGVPVVNRDFAGADRVIGYLGNTVPLRMRISPADTFTTLLARAREVSLAAYAHQDVDLDDIARAVDPGRSRGATGLFSIVLSLRSGVLEPLRAAGLTARRRHVPGGDARFDLTLAVETDGDDLTVEANHRATAAARARVADMLGQLDRLLAAALADPGGRLSHLVPLDQAEHDQLVHGWNDTATPLPSGPRLFPDLLAAQVAATPDATAVLANDEQLTYRQLDRRANQLARLLVEHGVGPETAVALAVPRCVDMVVAVLAVAKAGAAYVPVDPAYPADRVRLMLTDSRPGLLLTTAAGAGGLPDVPGLTTIRLDDEQTRQRLAAFADHDLSDTDRRAPLHPDHAAYVIYTSGSTGVPKGVVVAHGALGNHLAWAVRRFPGLAGHTLVHSSISFDFTVTPLLGPLVCGGAIELCEDSLDAIAQATGAATFLKITPSHLPLLPSVRFADSGPRTLVIAGEELRAEALAQWHDPADGEITVINEYGPTETTVGCLLHPIDPPGSPGVGAPGGVPVGLPVENTTCHLLDETLRPVPVGVPGELYVGGAQLARGYLNRPELTSTRFIADPFGQPGGRLYRTGDLMRRLSSGALQFLGRVDEQVKIRGFRVELGEIESVLLAFPGITQATVAARADGPGGPGTRYLAGYLVAAGSAEPDLAAVRAHLTAALPEHMVPATVSVVPAFPLSPSGKVDRSALPAPTFGGDATGTGPADADASGGNADGAPHMREPATRAEGILVDLFTEVLGGRPVGVEESFFELGGDSIMAISLVGRARRVGLRFAPRDVFAHRTVAALAVVATLDEGTPTAGAAQSPDDASGVGAIQATPIVRAFAERGPLADGHRMSVLVELPPAPGAAALHQALQAVLDRHGALRARLHRSAAGQAGHAPASVDIDIDIDGEPTADPSLPFLQVGPVGSVRAVDVLRRVDLGGEPLTDERVAQERAAAADELAPQAGRVLRAVWFDAGGERPGWLLLIAHHLVVDGVSWRILVEDLALAWREVADGRKPTLAPVPTSLRAWSDGLPGAARARGTELTLWRELLDGPDPVLGQRRADPKVDVWSTVRTVTIRVDPDTTEPVLTTVPALFFAGVEDVLLAALALALAGWGADRGQEIRSVPVLLEGHGRQESTVPGSDLSRTVGWFTSQHPVRLDTTGIDVADALAGGPAAGSVIKRVKEHLRSLPDHGIGFGLLRHLHPTAGPQLATRPEPQLGFNYLGRFDTSGAGSAWQLVPGGLEAAYGPDMAPPAGLVVNAVTEDGPDGPRLVAHWMYAAGLFDEATVADLAQRWHGALRALVRHGAGTGAGGRTPSDLSLVSLNQSQLDALEAMWRTA